MLATDFNKFCLMWPAFVADRVDPKGRHRIRANIPGLTKLSAWALPLTNGGGSAQRGSHIVPAKGAAIFVWFVGGDPDRPVYASGWWGQPEAGSEVPGDARDADHPEDVQVLELSKLRITIDERAGKEQCFIEDKVSGDHIQFDQVDQAMRIKATSQLVIECDGEIQIIGTRIVINGRIVRDDGSSI